MTSDLVQMAIAGLTAFACIATWNLGPQVPRCWVIFCITAMALASCAIINL